MSFEFHLEIRKIDIITRRAISKMAVQWRMFSKGRCISNRARLKAKKKKIKEVINLLKEISFVSQ